MDKKAAYITLNEEINSIATAAEKAHILLCDLADDYFATAPRTHQEELLKLYDFERYGIIASIIFDYVYQIKEIAEKIESFED